VDFGADGFLEVAIELDDPGLGTEPEDAVRVLVREAESSGGPLFGSAGRDALVGSDGSDQIMPGQGLDQITLGTGSDRIAGSTDDLDGDRLRGFGGDDVIAVLDTHFARDNMQVTELADGLDLQIDSDDDGQADMVLRLEGTFEGGDFMAALRADDVEITFETFLPILAEGQEVDPQLVNGIVNQTFLNGDMSSSFEIDLLDLGFAGYDNVLGAYEITPDGTLVDVQILSFNANTDKRANGRIDNVDPGNKLAFFIAQDAAEEFAPFDTTDSFEFVDLEGEAARLDDNADIQLLINGTAITATVYHSYSTNQNADGVQHVLSGVDAGGQSIVVGFEDLTGGGDLDYEDVAFRIAPVDELTF
jgi:hypothetical protein